MLFIKQLESVRAYNRLYQISGLAIFMASMATLDTPAYLGENSLLKALKLSRLVGGNYILVFQILSPPPKSLSHCAF